MTEQLDEAFTDALKGVKLPQIGEYFDSLDTDDSPMKGFIDRIEMTRWGPHYCERYPESTCDDLVGIYVYIDSQIACWCEVQVRKGEAR